jgi:hypothetical protein
LIPTYSLALIVSDFRFHNSSSPVKEGNARVKTGNASACFPVRELCVGEYRVFYDISKEDAVVYVRAIRSKPRGKKTEDIL